MIAIEVNREAHSAGTSETPTYKGDLVTTVKVGRRLLGFFGSGTIRNIHKKLLITLF
jgi:hypothetical protein